MSKFYLIISGVLVLFQVITVELLAIGSDKNNSEIKLHHDFDENGESDKDGEDYKWSWGYADNDIKLRSLPPLPPRPNNVTFSEYSTTTFPPDHPCTKYESTIPDFKSPERRISEIKCLEYTWQVNDRIEKQNRSMQCVKYMYERMNPKPEFALGGRDASPGEFPHMGAIGWQAVIGSWVFLCGGSLISANFLLTAAHCTMASDRDTSIADVIPKVVRLGDRDIVKSYSFSTVIDINIQRSIRHPSYNPPLKYYDIALMELAMSVSFAANLQPACLWTDVDTSLLGREATLTGWGITESGKTSPKLQAAVVDVIDTKTCDNLLRHARNRLWSGVKNHQLCAGKLAGGVDACQGDSGGPLQIKMNLSSDDEGSMHYIIGVTSFGHGCGRANTPGVYTKVSSFMDWIENTVWRV